MPAGFTPSVSSSAKGSCWVYPSGFSSSAKGSCWFYSLALSSSAKGSCGVYSLGFSTIWLPCRSFVSVFEEAPKQKSRSYPAVISGPLHSLYTRGMRKSIPWHGMPKTPKACILNRRTYTAARSHKASGSKVCVVFSFFVYLGPELFTRLSKATGGPQHFRGEGPWFMSCLPMCGQDILVQCGDQHADVARMLSGRYPSPFLCHSIKSSSVRGFSPPGVEIGCCSSAGLVLPLPQQAQTAW